MRRRVIALCVVTGTLAGVGGFTFRYAQGLSYFSNDPRACMNCHIMREHYESWTKSSHHAVATCNDCHIPHSFPAKYIAKGQNGWNHSRAFTLQDYPDPIRITDKNLRSLQANCIHCHAGMVQEIAGDESVKKGTARCTECHRSVGHMSLD